MTGGYHLAPDKNGNLTARLYLGPGRKPAN